MEIYQALCTSGGSWGQKPSIHPFTSSSKYLLHRLLFLLPLRPFTTTSTSSSIFNLQALTSQDPPPPKKKGKKQSVIRSRQRFSIPPSIAPAVSRLRSDKFIFLSLPLSSLLGGWGWGWEEQKRLLGVSQTRSVFTCV